MISQLARFIDGMTAHMFRSDTNGSGVVFYPNGVLGRGYVLPDAGAEQRTRHVLRWIMAGAIAGPIAGVNALLGVFGQPMAWPPAVWLTTGVVVALFALAMHVALRGLVRGLAESPQPLSLAQALNAQTCGLPRWYFYVMALAGPLLMVGSILWLTAAPSFMERIWAGVGLALFTAATVQAFAGLRMKPDEPPTQQSSPQS